MSLIKIPFPPNFSFAECRWFLDRNFDDCMHRVKGDTVIKTLEINGKAVLFEMHENNGSIEARILKGPKKATDKIKSFIIEWIDLDRDIEGFYKVLKKDAHLNLLYKKYWGLRLVGIPDLFELLCWCVIGQQINLDFAYKVKRALVERYGTKVVHNKQTLWLFPAPAILAEEPIINLKNIQLTTRKAEYIKGIAKLFSDGTLSKNKLLELKDEEKMKEELMKIRGIGEWTANYAVMKALGGLDCVPYGDSGINIALNQLMGIPKKNNRSEVEAVFERYRGWKSYLVYYLWRSRRDPL